MEGQGVWGIWGGSRNMCVTRGAAYGEGAGHGGEEGVEGAKMSAAEHGCEGEGEVEKDGVGGKGLEGGGAGCFRT